MKKIVLFHVMESELKMAMRPQRLIGQNQLCSIRNQFSFPVHCC